MHGRDVVRVSTRFHWVVGRRPSLRGFPAKIRAKSWTSFRYSFSLQTTATMMDIPPSASTSTAVGADATSTTISSKSTVTAKDRNGSSIVTFLRLVLLDIPLWVVVTLLVFSYLIQQVYLGPITALIDGLRMEGSTDDYGYYPELDKDVTYYSRQCDASDITTNNSNDLMVPADATKEEAADIMMTHGAVLIKNVLKNETASQLREYLEKRHEIQDQLGWQEKFWAEIGRLSLGLGVEDDPIIGQALEEVGNHPVVQKTVEGILGEDPAIVEISTLTTMHGATPQGTLPQTPSGDLLAFIAFADTATFIS